MREAIVQLFRQAGVPVSISMDAGRIADRVRVTARLNNVLLQDGLQSLLVRSDSDLPQLRFEVHSGRYFITSAVSLDLVDAEPISALHALFATINADFICAMQALGKGKVTLSVTDVTPEQVFSVIQRQTRSTANLTLSCVNGVYVVRSSKRHTDYRSAVSQLLCVDVHEASFYKVISALFASADLSFVLKDIEDKAISISATEEPFRNFVPDILRKYIQRYSINSKKKLTYMVKGDIFIFHWIGDDISE